MDQRIIDKVLLELKGAPLVNRGVEREALRVDSKGYLSKYDHPEVLGASLTNKYITTDYSEALLELVSPVFKDVKSLQEWFCDLHRFCSQGINGEFLWPLSMPCILEGADNIPIAKFGDSNVGKMKHLYRVGLSHRYGSAMQVISGIHYNFSLSDDLWNSYWKNSGSTQRLDDFKSQHYMSLVRNFLRVGWVIPYLFGASPAACKSFVEDKLDDFPFLKQRDGKLLYGDYATSLRMSDLGYRNFEQDSLDIKYNDVREYALGLMKAIRTPSDRWAKLGVRQGDDFKQLNDSILQIENEYYGMIRPKQIAQSGESPAVALLKRGIQYIEVRSVDINPFDPIGLDSDQMRFLDLLLLNCLRKPDRQHTLDDDKELKNNFNLVVLRGREPGLLLSRRGESLSLKDWGLALMDELERCAFFFDDPLYKQTVEKYRECFEQPERVLSSKVLKELEDKCYCQLGLDLAKKYKELFSTPIMNRSSFEAEAQRSLDAKRGIERDDHEKQVSFADYLDKYYHATAQCLDESEASIGEN